MECVRDETQRYIETSIFYMNMNILNIRLSPTHQCVLMEPNEKKIKYERQIKRFSRIHKKNGKIYRQNLRSTTQIFFFSLFSFYYFFSGIYESIRVIMTKLISDCKSATWKNKCKSWPEKKNWKEMPRNVPDLFVGISRCFTWGCEHSPK